MNNIVYKSGIVFELDEVIELYRISTLGKRRPLGDKEVMSEMIKNADIIITTTTFN